MIHSESLNFSHGRSSMLICIGHLTSQCGHLVHFTGSRFIPAKLFRWNIAISAPVGHTYLHQNLGTFQAAPKKLIKIRSLSARSGGTLFNCTHTSWMVGGFVIMFTRFWLSSLRSVGRVPNSVPSGEIAENGPVAKTSRALL